MKYYIIAGEASGDLHGSNMIKHLLIFDKEANIRAWGGDLMSKAGANVVKHYRDLAFMGFLEVAKNIGTIRKNFDYCKQDISEFKPDTVIFIDYPGFNLRMAKWAKEQAYRTQYYISPTIWAWNTGRVHKVKAYIDQMFTILPFELDFYKKYDYDAIFVGHPLMDAIDQFSLETIEESKDKPNVALLPGSRKQELEKILPILAKVVALCPEYHFILAAVPWQNIDLYKAHFTPMPINLQIETDRTYDILSAVDAGIITSGTATLETALFNVPQVVVYKTSAVTYFLAKSFAKIKHISLPNILLEEELLTELVQGVCTPQNIIDELNSLFEPIKRQKILDKYKELKTKLGDVGANERVAKAIYEDVQKHIS